MVEWIQKQNNWLSIVLAALSAAVLPRMSAFFSSTSVLINSIACFLFAAGAWALIRCAIRKLTNRLFWFSFVGGLLLSLSLDVGRTIFVERHYALTLGNLMMTLLASLAFCSVMTSILVIILSGLPKANNGMRRMKLETSRWNFAKWNPWASFFAVWVILLCCWLPAYLAYFPGIWGYDMHNQMHQALTHLYNTYQPLLHTLIFQVCYQAGLAVFGTGTGGVAFYTAVQMLLLSGMIAFVISYLIKRFQPPALLLWMTVAFYGLLPFHALLSISSTKDTIFAGIFLIALVQVYDICMNPRDFLHHWGKGIGYSITVLLCCLLRNNMIYAFAVLLPFVVLGIREKRILVALLLIVSMGTAVVGKGLLSKSLQATEGPRIEMLSIPMQQLARAYEQHGNEMTEEERQAIFTYLPEDVITNYYPLLSDPIKEYAKIGDGAPSILGFLGVWARMLPTYLNDYVDAFLLMTLGYWYPNGNLHSHIYDCYDEPDTEESLGYLYTGFMESISPDVEKHSVWPAAERYYQWFAHENNHEKIPVVSLLFNPGFYCWVIFIALLALLYYKQYQLVWPLALPYGVWLTLLLGPCVVIRYTYPLIACCPILLCALWNHVGDFQLREPVESGMKKGGRGAEMLRFAISGGAGFVIDYGCMILFKEALGIHYLLATALAFTISVVVNYFMCAYWVFQGADTKNTGVKAGFLLTSIIGLALNELFMFLLVDLAGIHYMIAKLIAVLLVMIWNYISKRKVLVHQQKNEGDAA